MTRGGIFSIAIVALAVGFLGVGSALGFPIDPEAPPTAVDAVSLPVDSSGHPPAGRTEADGGEAPLGFPLGRIVTVPEPGAAVQFSLGMVLLGVVGRRR
jgi:hypothetical protein